MTRTQPVRLPPWLRDGSWLFPLGVVTATEAAMALLQRSGSSVEAVLSRHASGDYGDVEDGERDGNARTILSGGYVSSVYNMRRGADQGPDAPPDPPMVWISTLLRDQRTVICTGDELEMIF